MSKRKENFNVTQGMTLLLLKKLSLPANLVFQLILFITDPENNIGYEDEQTQKNRHVLNKAVSLKISRKCFLVSTAEDLNSSHNNLKQR